MKTLFSAMVTSGVSVFFLLTGCATAPSEAGDEAEDGTDNEESIGTVSSAVGTCASTVSAAKLQQSRATHLLRYILGGTVPAGVVPSTCTGLVTQADYWRAKFAAGKKSTYSQYYFKDVRALSPTTICGLPTRPVRFTVWSTVDDYFGVLQDLTREMKKCYGSTVEPFVHISSSWTRDYSTPAGYTTFDMDPETAQYTASLSTTSGASASATLLSSGTATKGWRLPCSTCTPYYKSSIPIGAPCSYGTTSVSSGTKTDYEAVQPTRMSGYRRCANGSLL